VILDAGFLVDLLRGDPGARAALEELERGSEALRVPAGALARVAEAMARSRHPPREAERLRALLSEAPSVAFDAEQALRVGRLLADAERAGEPLDVFEAMVAAAALERDETLLTRNVREFGRVPELRLRAY
jgi:tRNA(fMet)-specific endonuclease VapC